MLYLGAMWGWKPKKPKRQLQEFSSFEELERNTLHLLDDYTDAELVAFFFAKRREWHELRGNNPDEMVGERKILVKKHWRADEYEREKANKSANYGEIF
jgi:hypothetical protein